MRVDLAAGLAGLGLSGAGLITCGVRTIRRPGAHLPDVEDALTDWERRHGGYHPRGVARAWLVGVSHLGTPLARRGVAPGTLTATGVWLAGAATLTALAGGSWPALGALCWLASAVADSLDGAVAALSARSSAVGHLLDSLADRVSDVLVLLALVALGGNPAFAVAAGGLLGGLEYTRARAGAAGFTGIGVATIGERPSRVLAGALGLLAAGLWPAEAGLAGTVAAAITGLVCLLGGVQFLRVALAGLRGRPAPGGPAPGGPVLGGPGPAGVG